MNSLTLPSVLAEVEATQAVEYTPLPTPTLEKNGGMGMFEIVTIIVLVLLAAGLFLLIRLMRVHDAKTHQGKKKNHKKKKKR